MNKYFILPTTLFLFGFTGEPIYPALADELPPGMSIPSTQPTSTNSTISPSTTHYLPLPAVAMDEEPMSLEDNHNLATMSDLPVNTAEIMQQPMVETVENPVVEQPVVTLPVVQAVVEPEAVPLPLVTTVNVPSDSRQAALQRHHGARSGLEEYINRVAKRLLLVGMQPELNYVIQISEENDFTIDLDVNKMTISITRGLLNELNDEAELAAVLALVMGSKDKSVDLDREAANTMYRAGYDPAALIELQEACFYAELDHKQHWLQQLYPNGITASKITANKLIVNKMPIGLMRGSQSYQEQIQG